MNKVTKIFAIIWIICVAIFLFVMGYVLGIRKELFDTAPSSFAFTLIGSILVGCLAFLIFLTSFTITALSRDKRKKVGVFVFLFKLFFTMTILPIYLVIYTIKAKDEGLIAKRSTFRKLATKIASIVFICTIILPVWAAGYFILASAAKSLVGYSMEPISVSGTGSMYPTFPKSESKDRNQQSKEIVSTSGMIPYPNGIVIGQKRYFGYEIQRGDIVVIENNLIREKTEKMYGKASGWVKRIVGLPGDTIEIRDGIVILNGEKIKEPYTAQPRSTFGEAFLSECKKVTVPYDSVFVMGDNRKGSGDSREVGFIEITAINHVLPLKNQIGSLDKSWRDTSKDFEDSSKTKLSVEKYIKLLNEKRVSNGVKELKYQPKLDDSAARRGETIIKYNDFSFEATMSGYTMAKAMSDSKYFNIAYGEVPTQGYFNEDELIENQFEFPNTVKFLNDKTFQEIGIAEVEGEINGCPTQIIVQHFAGYVPPNYSKETVESWRSVLTNLQKIQIGWLETKKWGSVYEKNKNDYDRINEIIAIRISNIQAIVNKMDKNQWLNDHETTYTKKDESLAKEEEAIANRLNSNQ